MNVIWSLPLTAYFHRAILNGYVAREKNQICSGKFRKLVLATAIEAQPDDASFLA